MNQIENLTPPLMRLVPYLACFGADLKRILGLSDVRPMIDALAKDLDLVAAPEPANSKVSAIASGLGVDKETVLAALRIIEWLCRTVNETDIHTIVKDFEKIEIIKPEEGPRLADLFGNFAGLFLGAFEQRAELSAIMPTFRSIDCDCHMRIVARKDKGEAEKPSIPVAIVRIQGDESAPFVLQCTPADLDRISEAVSDARRILSTQTK